MIGEHVVGDFFHEFAPGDEQSDTWRGWLRGAGVDPDLIAWDGWIERRDHRLIYLTHAERSGEPIHRQTTLHFQGEPPEFPR